MFPEKRSWGITKWKKWPTRKLKVPGSNPGRSLGHFFRSIIPHASLSFKHLVSLMWELCRRSKIDWWFFIRPCQHPPWSSVSCQHPPWSSVLCQHPPWSSVSCQHSPWSSVLCGQLTSKTHQYKWTILCKRDGQTRSPDTTTRPSLGGVSSWRVWLSSARWSDAAGSSMTQNRPFA